MKYYLLALSCAALLFIGLPVMGGTFLGDADGDNWATMNFDYCDYCNFNFFGDNCPTVFNVEQYDSDSDGYGNACDADYNNDMETGLFDFSTFKATYGQSAPTYNEQADHQCDGVVNLFDYAIFKNLYGSSFEITRKCSGGGKGNCIGKACSETASSALQIEFQESYAVNIPETVEIPHVMYAPFDFDWPDNGIGAIQVKYLSYHAQIDHPDLPLEDWQLCDWLDGALPEGWDCRVYKNANGSPSTGWWEHTIQYAGWNFPDDCLEESDAAVFYTKFTQIAKVPWNIPASHPVYPYPISADPNGHFYLFDCDHMLISGADVTGYSHPYIPQ